jgi:hypothetical protein
MSELALVTICRNNDDTQSFAVCLDVFPGSSANRTWQLKLMLRITATVLYSHLIFVQSEYSGEMQRLRQR